MCGRKAHRVDASAGALNCPERYFSIPCERIFNTHPQVKRSALVGIRVNGATVPLCALNWLNHWRVPQVPACMLS